MLRTAALGVIAGHCAPGNNRRVFHPLTVGRFAPHNQRIQPTSRLGKQACPNDCG
jgi:hypothetical protein